jgi:hypothetical protein
VRLACQLHLSSLSHLLSLVEDGVPYQLTSARVPRRFSNSSRIVRARASVIG